MENVFSRNSCILRQTAWNVEAGVILFSPCQFLLAMLSSRRSNSPKCLLRWSFMKWGDDCQEKQASSLRQFRYLGVSLEICKIFRKPANLKVSVVTGTLHFTLGYCLSRELPGLLCSVFWIAYVVTPLCHRCREALRFAMYHHGLGPKP